MCRSRIALLRKLNPDVPIFGLFGGDPGYRHLIFQLAGKHFLGLDGVHCSPQSGHWNWKNSDLVLAAWYRSLDSRIDFDIAHLIEWDLLVLEPLDRLYASVPEGAVGLTALTPLASVEHDWLWMQRPSDRRQWDELLAYARKTWDYDQVPHGCWGPGPCLPKSFLEQYAAIDVPELTHDELRLPLFAQILGFPIFDTGLRQNWYDREEDRFFNLKSIGVERDVIIAELAKPDGHRAFHPFRGVFGHFP